MRKYNYTFLEKDTIPGNLMNVLTGIYSMKTENDHRKDKFNTVFTELEKIAIVQSVKGSNAIEGILTTDQRINEIVNKSSTPLNHNEEEIASYSDALNLIHNHYQALAFSEENILSLHEMMLHVAKSNIAVKYKEHDNVIMEVKSDETRSIRFSPVLASETKDSMNRTRGIIQI